MRFFIFHHVSLAIGTLSLLNNFLDMWNKPRLGLSLGCIRVVFIGIVSSRIAVNS